MMDQQSPENMPPFADTSLLQAKRRAFDRPTQENLDALIKAAQDALLSGSAGAQKTCDCGAVLTQCTDCAISDYQAAHPDCPNCCVPLNESSLPSRGSGTPSS